MSHFLLILIFSTTSSFFASANDHIELPSLPQTSELDFFSFNALSEEEKISVIEGIVDKQIERYDYFDIIPTEVIREKEGKEHVTDITLSLKTTNYFLSQCNPDIGTSLLENFSVGTDKTIPHFSHLIAREKDSLNLCLGVQFLFKTNGRQEKTITQYLSIERSFIYEKGSVDIDFKTRFQGFQYSSKITIRTLNEDEMDQQRMLLIDLGKAYLEIEAK